MTEEEWRSALHAAPDAWPGVALDPAVFAAHAEAQRSRGGALPEHLGDLYLACAAARGDAAALRLVDERVFSAIDPAVRRVDPSPVFLDELRQVLRVRLLVGVDESPPRILEYRAGGPLLAWVSVAALRAALNLKRSQRPTISVDELLGEVVSREPDAELRHLKSLYRAELAEALREALLALPAWPRALLRLHYVDGVRLARIGALYGVHESTVSRWVSGAVEAVGDDARRRLRERLALSAESADSVARMVRSNLELSLRRILGSGSAEPDAG
jgi:RNA polymerase sigma-70 factor, ECF subfamily